jgi:hypothetical protein
LEKFCPTASANVNILEDINVEKEGLLGEKKMEKELRLSSKKNGKVFVTIAKRAAVKGKQNAYTMIVLVYCLFMQFFKQAMWCLYLSKLYIMVH